jgi:hypothetical protein
LINGPIASIGHIIQTNSGHCLVRACSNAGAITA